MILEQKGCLWPSSLRVCFVHLRHSLVQWIGQLANRPGWLLWLLCILEAPRAFMLILEGTNLRTRRQFCVWLPLEPLRSLRDSGH